MNPPELEIIKAQLRSANMILKGLRERNKELRAELKENRRLKQEYYKTIIPTLRNKKKHITKKL